MAVLKGTVVASVGDIKDSSGKSIGNDQLKKWVVNNGGRWAPNVGKGITHLISSKDAYKKDVTAVQQAKKLGIFIISYEWLEDSLQNGKKKLAERKYTWGVLTSQRRNTKQIKRLGPQADSKKFNIGCDLAKQDLDSGTSRNRPSSFFSSALNDLKKKREAREAEGKAKQAEAAKIPEALESAAPALKEDFVSLAQPTKSRPSQKSAASAPKRHMQQQLQPEENVVSIKETEDASPTTPPKSTPDITPTPSIFPSCLNYTPPSSSSRPTLPTPSKTPTPALIASLKPAESAPANPKLEDLYHIYLDNTGFEYKLILLRSNPYLNNFARYDLRLYESHTKPHVYCTVVRYMPPADQKPAAAALSPMAQNSDKMVTGTRTNLPSTTASTTPAQPPSPGGTKREESSQTNTPPSSQAARLLSLITPTNATTPSPGEKYKRDIAPPNSSFSTAFRAFRHAFRDLTLLSWHERLDAPLQRLRAQAFCIEPFVWRRPAEGLSTGFMPPKPHKDDEHIGTQWEEGYTRNAWGLPALDVPLGKEGSIGSALFREAEEARRYEEARRKRVEDAALRARNGGMGAGKKAARSNARFNKPLFNTATGPPRRTPAPKYYEPQSVLQRQEQEPVLCRTNPSSSLFSASPGGGAGASRASTPSISTQRSGKAIFMDYRTERQKWYSNSGSRFDY